MIEQKLTYTAPEAEALVVRFEGVICGSPTNEKMNNTSMSGVWSMDD